MRHFLSVWLVLVITLMALGSPLVASASVPKQVTYHGYLTAISGAPVNKSVTLQLTLYDVATGGAPLWTEQQVVTVTDGQFSVNLGAAAALNLPFDKPYYIGIKVDADQEMSPRQQFTSSPYALRSSISDAVADGTVGTGAIVNGAVTAAKLGISCTTGQVLMSSTSGWGCGTVSTSGGTGTITGIIAGNGIVIGGTTATPQIDVNFGGNGTAASSARSDHDHDAVYQKKYGKVAIVAQSGGDYTTPSAALADVAAWCGTPSLTSPCLVKIMPGVYDQGATSLAMLDFVDVEGSGETNTFITGSIDNAASGVVNGANATLERVAVTITGAANAQNAIAIFNSSATFKMLQTSVRAAGAVNTYAVFNSGTGSIRIGSSYLNTPGFTVFNGSTATAAIFATKFAGGSVSNAGTLACTASRDGNNVFFADTCPPFQVLSVIGSQPDYYGGPSSQSNSLIKVQFNNNINPSTITTSTFTVVDSMTGAQLNGSVLYDAGTLTATFTPSVALSGYLVATVTTGVRDMSGGKLAGPYSWSFSTIGGSPDIKPPAVIGVTPLDNSTGILTATSISVNFDEQIDRLTNYVGLLTLVDATNAVIPGKVQVSGQTVQFIPDAPLSLGVTYTATVSGVKDLAGNTQSSPYSWSFITAPIIAPSGVGASATTTDATVTWQAVTGATGYNLYWSTTPFGSNSGGSASPLGTAVTPTKVSGVTSPYVFTPPASLPFTGTLNIYASGSTQSPLSGVSFTLTVPVGITVTNISSPYGSYYGAPPLFNQSGTQVNINYATYGTSGDGSSPLLAVQCSGDFTGITLTDFTFSNVQITDYNGNPISGMNLTTTSNGTSGTTYYLAVTAANAGGESPNSAVVSATIDPLPPVVTSASPTGTNINAPGQISTNFSEPINMNSVTSATFAVTANGSPVTGTFPSYGGSTIMFQPTTPLQQGTTYSITISGIKDLAGNALVAPYTWSFSTAISAPVGLTATKGNLQSTLTWMPASGAASYNIYWSTMYGVTPQNGTKISVTTGTSYNHTGLTNGTTYYYVITAVNGTTEGQPSNQASVLIDNVPPTVTSTTPANNATGVSISSPICVNFSKSINDSTWNTTNVSFKDAAGAVVNGSYNSYGYCMGPSFTPSPALGFNTTYTMTVGTGVKDDAGNGLAAPYSFSFTTAAVGTPSGLIAAKGDLKSTLTWTAAAAATGYNIYWSTSGGLSPQNGTKISSVTGTSYTHTGLTNGTTYYYVVTAVNGAVEGLSSNQASVLIDNVSPTVTLTSPANNATGISISSPICVNFSEPTKSSTWNNTNVSFKDAAGAVVNGSYNSYVSAPGCYGPGFTPSPLLGFNTTYTMTIGAGVQDNAGNGLAAPYSFSFTTAAVGTPSGLTAAKGNLQSTLTWTAAAAATGYNIYWSTSMGVSPQNGTKISGVTGTSYTHTGLTNGTTYYYVVTAVNGAVEGLSSMQTSVLIDNVAPTVTSTSPAKDATGASISSSICVNFSKSINSSTWNTANVTFKNAAGAVVNGSYSSYSMGCYGPGFTPSPALGFNTTYIMTVGTGVQDNAGNGLAAPYSFSFTTALATPMGLTATAGTLQADLGWTAVSGATSYNIYWSNATGVTKTNSSKISTGSAATTYSHTSLANGSTYVYRVVAVMGSSESDLSNEVKVSFDTTPPVVSNKSGGTAGSSYLSFSFNEPIDSSSVTSDTIQVTSNGVAVSRNNFMGGGTSWYGTSVLNYGTTYTATISGVKDTAGNLMEPYSWTFTTSPLQVPYSVTSTPGSGQVSIAWSPVSGASAYNVYWSTTPGVTKATGTKITGATSPYVHTGLTAGTDYYFVVTTVSGSTESAESTEVNSAGLLAPSYVNVMYGTVINSFTNTITWPSVVGATGYNLYWSSTSGVNKNNGTKISNVTSNYSHTTGIAAGQTYYYVVTSVNGAVESGSSPQYPYAMP